MPHSKLFSATLAVLVTTLILGPSLSRAADLRAYHDSLQARYARAHSLGDNYQFEARDGWQSVNITNLQYKYRRDDAFDLEDTDGNDADGDRDGDIANKSNTLYKRDSKKSSASKKAKTSHAKAKSSSKSKTKASSKAKTGSKAKADSKSTSKAKDVSNTATSATKGLSHLQSVVETIKGVGKAEPVMITWYTGHDLLNPSCWPNPSWAPTASELSPLIQ